MKHLMIETRMAALGENGEPEIVAAEDGEMTTARLVRCPI
jgi:hypothetical protein